VEEEDTPAHAHGTARSHTRCLAAVSGCGRHDTRRVPAQRMPGMSGGVQWRWWKRLVRREGGWCDGRAAGSARAAGRLVGPERAPLLRLLVLACWICCLPVRVGAPGHVGYGPVPAPVALVELPGTGGNVTRVLNHGVGSTCPGAPSENVRYLHGGWMALSWSTVVAVGVFIARYCRHRSWWLTAHITLMTIGSLGTAGFVVVAITMVQPDSRAAAVEAGPTDAGSRHHLLGGLLGLCTMLQASAGKFVHEMDKADKAKGGSRRRRARMARWYHIIQGKLLLGGAVYQIWMGLEMLLEHLSTAFLVYCAAVGLVFVAAEVRLHVCPPPSTAITSATAAAGVAVTAAPNHTGGGGGGGGRAAAATSQRATACAVCIAACGGASASALTTHVARHGERGEYDTVREAEPEPEAAPVLARSASGCGGDSGRPAHASPTAEGEPRTAPAAAAAAATPAGGLRDPPSLLGLPRSSSPRQRRSRRRVVTPPIRATRGRARVRGDDGVAVVARLPRPPTPLLPPPSLPSPRRDVAAVAGTGICLDVERVQQSAPAC
jgi:hypothetical protein